jgi:hypothetical protein
MTASTIAIPGPIDSPAAWTGADYQNSTEWLWHLSPEDLAEFDAALRHQRGTGKPMLETDREDFPLPTLSTRLQEVVAELENGRGFILIRGLDLDRYTEDEARAIYWGIGRHMGFATGQSSNGDLLASVRDEGRVRDADLESRQTVRSYQARVGLEYHSDASDIVGLMCIRPAKVGGVSTISSSTTVFNVMLAERPDLVAAMFEPFPVHWKGEGPANGQPYYITPVFSYFDGKLSCRYNGFMFRMTQETLPNAPRLSAKQLEAMEYIDAVASREGIYLDMSFQRGDIQFLNNYTILHARGDYEDFPDPDLRRHLIRQWVTLYSGRKLAPGFTEADFVVPPGVPRGGRYARNETSPYFESLV